MVSMEKEITPGMLWGYIAKVLCIIGNIGLMLLSVYFCYQMITSGVALEISFMNLFGICIIIVSVIKLLHFTYRKLVQWGTMKLLLRLVGKNQTQ